MRTVLVSVTFLFFGRTVLCSFISSKYCDVVSFLQGRDTHMRQIKVHSPVQDRIGGTEASDVIQFQNIFNRGIHKREFYLFVSLSIL
jgi:hypothetical protein